MSRWKPDARGRLQEAAFALFHDPGYANVTVADIAARAGLTERTFFRHFADKREVLFSGSELLHAELLRSLAAVPPDVPTIEAVQIAVESISAFLHGRREFARMRKRIVDANADLQERELIKRAALTTTLAQGLRDRGVAEPGASLAADLGMGVFHVGFVTWLEEEADREFVAVVHDGFTQLRAVTAGV